MAEWIGEAVLFAVGDLFQPRVLEHVLRLEARDRSRKECEKDRGRGWFDDQECLAGERECTRGSDSV